MGTWILAVVYLSIIVGSVTMIGVVIRDIYQGEVAFAGVGLLTLVGFGSGVFVGVVGFASCMLGSPIGLM